MKSDTKIWPREEQMMRRWSDEQVLEAEEGKAVKSDSTGLRMKGTNYKRVHEVTNKCWRQRWIWRNERIYIRQGRDIISQWGKAIELVAKMNSKQCEDLYQAGKGYY